MCVCYDEFDVDVSALSCLNSFTIFANASGFTPISHNDTRMESVSLSSPVSSSCETSYSAVCECVMC